MCPVCLRVCEGRTSVPCVTFPCERFVRRVCERCECPTFVRPCACVWVVCTRERTYVHMGPITSVCRDHVIIGLRRLPFRLQCPHRRFESAPGLPLPDLISLVGRSEITWVPQRRLPLTTGRHIYRKSPGMTLFSKSLPPHWSSYR